MNRSQLTPNTQIRTSSDDNGTGYSDGSSTAAIPSIEAVFCHNSQHLQTRQSRKCKLTLADTEHTHRRDSSIHFVIDVVKDSLLLQPSLSIN